jgi:hypothetical protein
VVILKPLPLTPFFPGDILVIFGITGCCPLIVEEAEVTDELKVFKGGS